MVDCGQSQKGFLYFRGIIRYGYLKIIELACINSFPGWCAWQWLGIRSKASKQLTVRFNLGVFDHGRGFNN